MNHQTTESWDLDLDLDIPSGPLSLHLSSGTNNNSDIDTGAESSATALFSGEEGIKDDWGEDDNMSWEEEFESNKRSGIDLNFFSESNEDQVDEKLDSIGSKSSTIKGLSGTFSILSLASSNTTPISGPGRVMHLGSTPKGKVTSLIGDGDWDEDLDLPNSLSIQSLKSTTSFTSHIPSDNEDDSFEFPTPRTSKKSSDTSRFTSNQSNGEEEESDFDESEFNLPSNMSKITFSPLLSRSIPSTQHVRTAATSNTLNLSTFTHSIPSPSHDSWLDQDEGVLGGEDDESFFEEIVLPSYFSGGPGALTPPPDGEGNRGRIDLQGILKRKLELRGKESQVGKNKMSRGGSHLEDFKESIEDESEEFGLELNEELQLKTQRSSTSRIVPSLKRKGAETSTHNTPIQQRRPPILNRTTLNVANSPTLIKASPLQRAGAFGTTEPTGRLTPSNLMNRERRVISTANDRVLPKTPNLQPFLSPVTSSSHAFPKSITSPTTPIQRRLPPPRIDTTLPSPRTPRIISATSSTNSNNNINLRSKKSQPNLSLTPNQHQHQNTRQHRPPTPSSSSVSDSPRNGRSTPSFSSGTVASGSRVRERVHSGSTGSISSTNSSDRPASRNSSSLYSGINSISATTNRLTQPTLASQAKKRVPASPTLSGINIPPTPLQFSRPKRSRDYGNGMELNGFDDLVVSKDRESKIVLPIGSSGSGKVQRRNGSGSISSVRSLSSGGSGSLSSATGKKVASSTGTKTTTRSKRSDSNSSNIPIASTSSNRLAAKRGKDESSDDLPVKKRGLKREPQLIKNLGPKAGTKDQGEMIWNEVQQKWEGNESILKDFDKIISTSSRPALITNSPARFALTSPTLLSAHSSITSGSVSRSNVKVVGSMLFDPIKMTWISLAPEGEEELDLNFEGDMADDEGEGKEIEQDGWEKGENARMLKSRASFIMSEAGESDNGEGNTLWNESAEAERQHSIDMKSWTMQGEINRKELWNLRSLILADTPPR